MDGQSPRYRHWLSLVVLPLALVIMVPVVVVLGLSFYVRAAVIGLVTLIRYLLDKEMPAAPGDATQPPHLFDVPIATQKNQE